MHERRFNREIERLRDPERVATNGSAAGDRPFPGRIPIIPKLFWILAPGPGLLLRNSPGEGLAVTGLDANPEMLPVARQFVPAADFQEGVAEALPFGDGLLRPGFHGLTTARDR